MSKNRIASVAWVKSRLRVEAGFRERRGAKSMTREIVAADWRRGQEGDGTQVDRALEALTLLAGSLAARYDTQCVTFRGTNSDLMSTSNSKANRCAARGPPPDLLMTTPPVVPLDLRFRTPLPPTGVRHASAAQWRPVLPPPTLPPILPHSLSRSCGDTSAVSLAPPTRPFFRLT